MKEKDKEIKEISIIIQGLYQQEQILLAIVVILYSKNSTI